MTCYDYVKQFKKKFKGTVAWRLFQNAHVVDLHINPDEKILYAFAGQKNDSPLDFFETAAIAITQIYIMTCKFMKGLYGEKL